MLQSIQGHRNTKHLFHLGYFEFWLHRAVARNRRCTDLTDLIFDERKIVCNVSARGGHRGLVRVKEKAFLKNQPKVWGFIFYYFLVPKL